MPIYMQKLTLRAQTLLKTKGMHAVLKLLPLLIPFLMLFAGGLTLAVVQSLGMGLPFAYKGGMFDAYVRLLEPHYLHSFLLSLRVGFFSAVLAVISGTLLAIGLWRLPAAMQQGGIVYKIPLILPHIVVAFIVILFWTQSGLLASIAHHLGWISAPEDFPPILYGGSGTGMILSYVYKETPFVLLMAYAALKRLDARLIDTARMLGGSYWMILRTIILPHLFPVMHTTFIILFLFTFGAFEVPFLLGESRPGMLSIEAYNLYFQHDITKRPAAMAILVTMFAFSIACIVLYIAFTKRFSKRGPNA